MWGLVSVEISLGPEFTQGGGVLIEGAVMGELESFEDVLVGGLLDHYLFGVNAFWVVFVF